MFACSGAYFQDLPDSADILITQRNDFRVCDCVVRSAFPDLYISQVRSAAGAYDSGAGGDITKALPLAIDQNANQRHTAPADRAIDRSEYPAHQVITKRGLRTIFFQKHG